MIAADEELLTRLRSALANTVAVEEKKMFNGITFMVNQKMCLSVSKAELMCRIDTDLTSIELERQGTREMIMKGRVMKGYLYVEKEALRDQKTFDHYIRLCLDFNEAIKV